MAKHDLTFVDLFAGCGGLALGFLREGFGAVGAVEIDPDAAETYALNIDDNIHVDDIGDVKRWPRAQVVIGGPPCQGFSQLGTRDPDDPRNQLWREYVNVLEATRAEVFVMENVPQLFRSPQFELFLEDVAELEFDVVYDVLNAADYGAPQTRRRAIVIGSRICEPHMPTRTHGPQSDSGKAYVDVRSAFSIRQSCRTSRTDATGTTDVPVSGTRLCAGTGLSLRQAATVSRCRTHSTPTASVTWSPAVGERNRRARRTSSDGCGGTDRHRRFGQSSTSRRRVAISIRLRTGRSPCVRRHGSSRSPTTSCSPTRNG